MDTISSSKKRILVIGPSVKATGGVATVHRAIVESETLKENFDFHLLPTWDERGWGKQFIRALFNAGHEIREADLIHLSISVKGSTFRKLILSIFFGKTPYIIHLHSGVYDKFYENSGTIAKILIRRLFVNAASVVCVSDYQLEAIKNVLPEIEKKLVRVYNGVNFSEGNNICNLQALKSRWERPESVEQSEGKNNCNHNLIQVLYLGRIKKNRHIDEFLKLAEDFADKNTSFVVAGEGDKSDWNNYKVTYLGHVTGEEKEKVLNRSDILYDYFTESFGIGLVEAMNHHCCVLGLNAGAIPEVIGEEHRELLFNDYAELKSKLERLCENNELLDTMKETLYERSKKFSIENFYMEIGNIYKSILDYL